MHKSRGESVEKLGAWFTSKSHGFKLLSNIISKLYN